MDYCCPTFSNTHNVAARHKLVIAFYLDSTGLSPRTQKCPENNISYLLLRHHNEQTFIQTFITVSTKQYERYYCWVLPHTKMKYHNSSSKFNVPTWSLRASIGDHNVVSAQKLVRGHWKKIKTTERYSCGLQDIQMHHITADYLA